jgi:hypothetical protein
MKVQPVDCYAYRILREAGTLAREVAGKAQGLTSRKAARARAIGLVDTPKKDDILESWAII